jgi:hypothetical protein
MPKATFLKERAIIFSSGTGKELQDTQVKLKRPYKYLWRLTLSPEARFLSVMDSIFCWNLMRSMGKCAKGDVIGSLTWSSLAAHAENVRSSLFSMWIWHS